MVEEDGVYLAMVRIADAADELLVETMAGLADVTPLTVRAAAAGVLVAAGSAVAVVAAVKPVVPLAVHEPWLLPLAATPTSSSSYPWAAYHAQSNSVSCP